MYLTLSSTQNHFGVEYLQSLDTALLNRGVLEVFPRVYSATARHFLFCKDVKVTVNMNIQLTDLSMHDHFPERGHFLQFCNQSGQENQPIQSDPGPK